MYGTTKAGKGRKKSTVLGPIIRRGESKGSGKWEWEWEWECDAMPCHAMPQKMGWMMDDGWMDM